MRQLTEQDRERILEYIAREPEVNIFIRGDIENFGVQCREVSVWVNEAGGAWDSVALRFFDDFVVYSQTPGYDAAAVAALLKAQNAQMISGKAAVVARLEEYFPERRLRSMVLTKCTTVKEAFAVSGDITLRKLAPDDAEDIVDLMMQIDEFRQSYGDRAVSIAKTRTNLSRGGTYFGAYTGGTLVSSASTGAENSMSAMVVGVATRPGFRGRGYASAVVSKLCEAAFQAGKEFLCLFYDNPQAGRIYNRIGFDPCEEYALFK
ncbi:hypothetical protein SAMN02745823_02933 [Sporobacter termitidis DSM 10068]|uniref:N-acetyltransferase domain-containing protein n=1 Tax=Sporobacter termitidis DSM 10068 TaxID=1123282 RepID=A0A1M5YWM5_9FIRM|nr:GNAT family N-acetyltransferase [Sporobacter termitidis]SHI16462.1 hypothetical protein SAMN02745823_02933 [Sporobacter termitidis DSM 10068]